MAGMVTPTPNAIDSPADPAVCTILFSRIVASFMPSLLSMRNSVIEITATGIDALTVSPTLSTRYSDDAPKIIPRIVPTKTPRKVNSLITVLLGMYGTCVGVTGVDALMIRSPVVVATTGRATLARCVAGSPQQNHNSGITACLAADRLPRSSVSALARRESRMTGGIHVP